MRKPDKIYTLGDIVVGEGSVIGSGSVLIYSGRKSDKGDKV